MIPMWTTALIALVGALAVGLDVTLLVEKFKGNLDEVARQADESNRIDRVVSSGS